MDLPDTPAQMTTQPLTDVSLIEDELTATGTWNPHTNPNPEWVHLTGVPGMEHLVEAAHNIPLITPINIPTPINFPEDFLDGEATPPERAHLTGPVPRIGARHTWFDETDIRFSAPPMVRNDEDWNGANTPNPAPLRPAQYILPVSPTRPDFMEPLTNGSSAVSSPIDRGAPTHTN